MLNYALGTVFTPSDTQKRRGITGYSCEQYHRKKTFKTQIFAVETIKDNLLPQFRDGHNFFSVFAGKWQEFAHVFEIACLFSLFSGRNRNYGR